MLVYMLIAAATILDCAFFTMTPHAFRKTKHWRYWPMSGFVLFAMHVTNRSPSP